MKNSKKNRIIKMCESCGWRVNTSGEEWEIENMEAPFIFAARPEEIKIEARAAYDDFDEDDFVFMYLEAKRNGLKGVPSVRGLLKAAEKIYHDLEALAMNTAPGCY